KLYHLNTPIPLSDALPILENMGLRVLTEQPYGIHITKEHIVWINDFAMTTHSAHEVHIDEVKDLFQETFEKVWFNEAENDGFNRLALLANLSWREISMLRAYAKYLKQINFTFTQAYIEEIFSKYPGIARELVTLFKLRFDPNRQGGSQEVITALDERIDTLLSEVDSLDEDKILRRFREIIMATLRTNFFLKDDKGQYKEYISFKLDAMNISDMPLPRPLFEIFIYAPRFEGVHLRSGKVARGGLRWSDRREDFRTEILGLMKAQRVKNSVIVPTGAKGGFVLKQLPKNASREMIQEEGITCYKKYIRALLDLTDNRVEGEIVTPKDLIHYDEVDPYLVVAADKGTATFSDYANEVALQTNFWLGDAFASGGKTRYDHKKMGITARGAWESVKRHFREMGCNIQTTPFTVIGIGDMAGDVFGNGMLLSQQIQLVGAFNHAHIFLDPNPDAALSFNERKRLFELPRSTWADYNPDLISAGGGVFSRNVKSIKLSPEIKKLLGIDKDMLEPNQLIHAMLKAEVDLLWNGGIGTYIKASTESHAEVGDKANDALRVNGCDLRAKVVGEGGNLGATQRGRIEYALAGGRIVTDFIDNSAGVDCSDHEVNIKILLNQVVANGDMTEKQRNELLASMTDEVGKLVLRNNYTQTQAISLARGQTKYSLDLFIQVMEDLERVGLLDRALEFLPTDKELQERKGADKGLTSPELAVLLAYFKIFLKEELLKSSTPEDPYVSKFVKFEFPATLHERFYDEII
ncbi:MAG: NAD-glutamate dehydrogenase, partial [Gammaproteobacteria bacterium]|nr:NAD-glutamate dehydrogenase [Gammaproteobacteria bacterium]